MEQPLDVLKKYWNHDSFRPLQLDIISSVLNKKDTLALLPTGGGKSICFQVPALILEGICLVISPLTALINDQVANLTQRGLRAMGLTGVINHNQLMVQLDNCHFGNYKFLYLSPERLQNEFVLERIKQMPISFVAIDEAHCVSQWGHDFRPAFLKIKTLRVIFSDITFLALTATATSRVEDDIAAQLELKEYVTYRQSFTRPNIAYISLYTEDKFRKITQVLRKNPESSIVYVRNRKACVEISNQLISSGFSATFFHGGLQNDQKTKNMTLWMSNKVQVIVATNAFGMGIDKADVKTVIHYQAPENIENYYQESGRAGRNNQRALAVLLVSKSDGDIAKKQLYGNMADKDFLKLVYNKLCNQLQVPFGEGADAVFTINFNQFCSKYGFAVQKTYQALQFLDQQNLIGLTNIYTNTVSLRFLIASSALVDFINLNLKYQEVITAVLRNYYVKQEEYIGVNTFSIAKQTNKTEGEVVDIFSQLQTKGILSMISKNNDLQIIFTENRDEDRHIPRISKHLTIHNKNRVEQFESMAAFIANETTCKNSLILSYFGEKPLKNCGICSNCLKNKDVKSLKIDLQSEKIVQAISIEPQTSQQLQERIILSDFELITVLQNLLESKKVKLLPNNQYALF